MKEGFSQRLLKTFPPRTVDLWVQAVSVGEAFLALEIVKNLPAHPSLKVLITSNTKQGMEILAKELDQSIPHEVEAAYFPFDKPAIMREALQTIKPRLVVLLESELWPGLLYACKKGGVRTLLLNGRMTEKSLASYLFWPSFWRYLAPDKILAMSEDDTGHFRALFGQEKVGSMQNIKFDRVATVSVAEKNKLGRALPGNVQFLVLASIRQSEEEQVANLILEMIQCQPDIVVGLFPRHMHRLANWEKILDRLSLPWQLRSETSSPVKQGTVLLWDVFGELGAAYHYSQAVYVGGSMVDLGGQNFLEPLTCGCKPVVGKHWDNFFWVGREIITSGLVDEVNTWQELRDLLLRNMKTPVHREKLKEQALKYVSRRQGGTRQACESILESLKNA
ncbi:MAG: glycosyltransferase N-terminal domain-containing protein [Thermodesulfobacteriota bacterium]